MKRTPAPFTILHAAEVVRGGVATVVNQLVAHQQAQPGTRVLTLVPKNEATYITHPTHTFKRTGRTPLSLVRFAFALAAAVIKQKPHVVHLHSTFAGAIARPLLFILRPFHAPRVIYCPHGWSFLMQGSRAKQTAFAWLERILAPLTHTIICVSEYEKQSAIRHGLPAQRLVVIPNGINLPPDTPTRPKVGTKRPLQLLFIGRQSKAKGLDILLDAMAALSPATAHLTVLGVSEEDGLPQLPHVTYQGWVSPAKLPAYFAKADALCLPSRWEGLPMVGLEALAHSVPLLASTATSLPELAQPNKTGQLISPNTPTAWKDMLTSLTPQSLAKLSGNTRSHVQMAFSLKNTCARTWACYGRS